MTAQSQTSTLLLRLAGPMQAWGTQSRWGHRDTGREPSKSGLVGLLCAALGRPRSEPVADLAALRMGVRVDREGTVLRDYHTAGGGRWLGGPYGVVQPDGKPGETVLSDRFYLSDASFLVGLEGDAELLHRLDVALAAPVWFLSLGRAACVPGEPVRLPDGPPLGPGLREAPLEEALAAYPWVARHRWEARRPPERLRLVMDAPAGEDAQLRLRGADVRRDVPVSFAAPRAFADRAVLTTTVPLPPVVVLEDLLEALASAEGRSR